MHTDVQLDQNRSPGKFAGIDNSTVWIREPFEARYVPLPVEHVLEVIDSSGILVATDESILHALEKGVALAHMEGRNAAIVLEGHPPVSIPFEDIESATMVSGASGKWIGCGVGGALDLTLIWALTHAEYSCGPTDKK